MLEQMEGSDLELSGSDMDEDEMTEDKLDQVIDNELAEQEEDGDGLYMDFSGGEEEDASEIEQIDDEEEIDINAVTESKILEWVNLINSNEPAGLFHLSRALYAALIAIDDREPATADKVGT